MAGLPDLESLLGKNVSAVCGNRFHDPNANHAAHFVSHVLGLTFGFNCRDYLDGKQEGANLRVIAVVTPPARALAIFAPNAVIARLG